MMRLVLALLWLILGVRATAQPPDGASFYVTAEVVPSVALAGEQVRYVVTAYSDTLRDVTLVAPTFMGVYQGETRNVSTSVTIDSKQYNVVIFAVTIYPSRSGSITLPPAEVIFEGTVLEAPYTLSTNSVELTVNPPPIEAFSGLVGRHTVAFTLDVTSTELGQPIIAEYRVAGTGYVTGLPAPRLVLPDGWRSYLDPAQTVSSSDGTVTTTEKIFRWRILPDRAGVLNVGVAPLIVYDLVSGDYAALEVEPISVQILAGVNGETVRPSVIAALENSSLGLPPAVDHGTSAPSDRAWAIAPLIMIAAVVGRGIIQRVRAGQRALRRKNALHLAQSRLSKAAKLTDQAALRAIESAAAGYLRDREGRETPAIRESLILVESARYAPQIEDVAGLAAVVYTALAESESEGES